MDNIFSRNGTLSQMFDVANTVSSIRSDNSSRLGGIIKLVMSLFT